MISQQTYQKILGIEGDIAIDPTAMADKMNITFYPNIGTGINKDTLRFKKLLEETFLQLGVNIVPIDEAFGYVPWRKYITAIAKAFIGVIVSFLHKVIGKVEDDFIFDFSALKYSFVRKKIKKNISIVCVGDFDSNDLPMRYITSFKDSSIITIVDFPAGIDEQTPFDIHFKTSMKLFVHHMTNIIIGVSEDKWILYNFNASHPIYPIDGSFKDQVLNALIPKIVAPIRPYKLDEFQLSVKGFSVHDHVHHRAASDVQLGAQKISALDLYPPPIKLKDLSFRDNFCRWLVDLHLDSRKGMSFGFLARQLPTTLGMVYEVDTDRDFFVQESKYFLVLNLKNKKYAVEVPEVWVLTQKSGTNKVNVNIEKDFVKLGLYQGQMKMQIGEGSLVDVTQKPSFDTKVILAHALGNLIIASLLNHFNPEHDFVTQFTSEGIAIVHWHGYFHPENIPTGMHIHGLHNPHVACSSPQSALYALSGKLDVFKKAFDEDKYYKGDIHVEPHHGINVNYFSIESLADYLVENPQASVLGNKYLYLYNK